MCPNLNHRLGHEILAYMADYVTSFPVSLGPDKSMLTVGNVTKRCFPSSRVKILVHGT